MVKFDHFTTELETWRIFHLNADLSRFEVIKITILSYY